MMEEKSNLGQEVEGEPGEENVWEELDYHERRIHHPVSQPLKQEKISNKYRICR